MLRDPGKQPGFAEAGRERMWTHVGRIRLQPVDPAFAFSTVVNDQKFSIRIQSNGRNLQLSIGNLSVPQRILPVVTNCPDLAGGIVAVNVGARQFLQLAAVVDNATGQRT